VKHRITKKKVPGEEFLGTKCEIGEKRDADSN
jgi:hypothetical protein